MVSRFEAFYKVNFKVLPSFFLGSVVFLAEKNDRLPEVVQRCGCVFSKFWMDKTGREVYPTVSLIVIQIRNEKI